LPDTLGLNLDRCSVLVRDIDLTDYVVADDEDGKPKKTYGVVVGVSACYHGVHTGLSYVLVPVNGAGTNTIWWPTSFTMDSPEPGRVPTVLMFSTKAQISGLRWFR
jgi:hypothetical protein